MALYDTNNNLTSDPYSLCESMGQCLTALGGPPDFQIEPQLIDSLMELSPSIPQDAPHPEFTETFFNTLLSNSNPVKAPGFDNTNLYLFHLAPKHIKSLLFHICSDFITNPIPKTMAHRSNLTPLQETRPPQPHQLLTHSSSPNNL